MRKKQVLRAMVGVGAILVVATAPKLYFNWTETAFITGAVLMAVGIAMSREEGEECCED